MNKKFMIVALMAALSTVGYAFDTVGGKVQNVSGEAVWGAATIDEFNKNLNSVVDATDANFVEVQSKLNGKLDKTEADKFATKDEVAKVETGLNSLKDQVSNNTATTTVNSELIGKLTTNKADKADLDALKDQVSNNTATTTVNSELIGKLTEQMDQKADKEEFDHLKNEVNGNSQALGELGKDIVALGKENDKQNDRLDATEDRLDLGDRIDGVQNQQIGALQTENVEQNNRLDKVEKENGKQNAAIEANKNQIEQNRQDIAKGDQINKVQNQQIGALQTENVEQNNRLDKVEKENDEQNGRLDKVEGKNKEQDKTIAQNKQDIADLRNDYTQVNGRLSGLEKKVDNLDNKMNKGLSLMAAMNAVDFQNVQTGEMAIGAGIGHYGNAQSVALGVAYAPVEDLTVNAKYSITAGDPDSFAVGAGATYKFKVGR